MDFSGYGLGRPDARSIGQTPGLIGLLLLGELSGGHCRSDLICQALKYFLFSRAVGVGQVTAYPKNRDYFTLG